MLYGKVQRYQIYSIFYNEIIYTSLNSGTIDNFTDPYDNLAALSRSRRYFRSDNTFRADDPRKP